MKKDSDVEDAMKAMEGAADYAAFLTGIKKQFIGMGWTERGAEEATLEMFRASRGIKQ